MKRTGGASERRIRYITTQVVRIRPDSRLFERGTYQQIIKFCEEKDAYTIAIAVLYRRATADCKLRAVRRVLKIRPASG
jgi:hypothetical protein